MRVLVVGDQHFRHELSYGASFSDGRRAEWRAILDKIHDTAKDVDAVVLLGDNLNSRHNHSSVVRDFVGFIKGFGDKEIHILSGNHERYGDDTALDFLERAELPNVHVYTTPRYGYVKGHKAFFLPYVTSNMMGVKTKHETHDEVMALMQDRAEFLFLHHGILGSIWDGGKVEEGFNEPVFKQDELEQRFDRIFGGHIHAPMKLSDKTVVAGSIFTTEVGETEKYVWVIDTDKNDIERINLPVRGIYKITVKQATSYAYIPKGSIVKAIVTDPFFKDSIHHVREILSHVDAVLIIEQYPDTRRPKVHFEEGALDLSFDALLKEYSDMKGLNYNDLKDAYSIIESYDFNRPRSIPS